MRKLSTEKRASILAALAEGNSIASVCRMIGVNKRTVLRLLVDAGTFAEDLHDRLVRDLDCKRVECDEVWSFVACKQKSMQLKNWGKGYGDAWVWVSLCADSKIVINWTVGGRDSDYARPFMHDLASRLNQRIQLSTDGLPAYLKAVPEAFGDAIDYAMIQKQYAPVGGKEPDRRYSPAACIGVKRRSIIGCPMAKHVSTSYIERQNLTLRLQNRRFTRLTNAFSKERMNHEKAVALHYFGYNFMRKHQTLKTTPAVAAGVACREWTWLDFVELLEAEELERGGRLTDYQPAASKRSDN